MGFFRKENNLITYTIDRGDGCSLAISVQEGQVAVTAPWYVSKRKIDKVVINKKNWILQKIREYEEENKLKKSHLESQKIKVFEKEYNLEISYKKITNPELNLGNEEIKIDLPIKYRNVDNTRIINLVLEKFYKRVCEKEVENIMEKTRLALGIAPDNYKIQKISENVLGKFIEENKNIIINPEIVKYNRNILEYIILHEFCHLKYKTHGKNFYKIIEKYMPNFKDIEKQVKGLF